MKKVLSIFLIGLLLNACVALNKSEKETLYEVKQYGVRENIEEVVNPTVAGVLNILPGIGNFYLGGASDEKSQWIYGVLNLLTWPISIFWSIPQALIDAETINKKETAYYYQFNPKGKVEFEKLKKINNVN